MYAIRSYYVGAQQANADKFYKIENEKSIEMINTSNAAKRVIVEVK